MRQIFPEWYAPSEVELGSLLETATIALDANVLLDLYRVSTSQRDQILDLLNQENVQPRVWMPYQAALEYQRSRLKVAREHEGHYRTVQKSITELPKTLHTAVDALRDDAVRAELHEKIEEVLGPVHEPLRAAVSTLESANVIAADGIYSIDPIRDRIDTVLSEADQVGPQPSDETIAQRKSQMELRYAAKVPPGYADKKDDPSGDLLIWFEVLERAERRPDHSLIFITSDAKPDWYLRANGQTLGPRVELIAEYRAKATTGTYHQMTLKSFLHHANTYLGATVAAETIASVQMLADARVMTANHRRAILAKYPRAEERLTMALKRVPDEESRNRSVIEYAFEMLAGETPFEEPAFANALLIADNVVADVLAQLRDRFETLTYDLPAKSRARSDEQTRLASALGQAIRENPSLEQWIDRHSEDEENGWVHHLDDLAQTDPKAHRRLMAIFANERVQEVADEIIRRTNASDR